MTPDPPVRRFAFVLLPDFNMMSVVAAIDPLRVANYLGRRPLYGWQLLSAGARPVKASNGMTLPVDGAIGDDDRFDAVFVCSSWASERHRDPGFVNWLRRLARRGCILGGLDTGALVLAHAGLMTGYRAAVHYEHIEGFREEFPDIAVGENLFCIDRTRLTAAAGTAPMDLMLTLVAEHHGGSLATAVGRYLFHDPARGEETVQIAPLHDRIGLAHRGVRDAIAIMEETVESPIPPREIARRSKVSLRQLERLFVDRLGQTPLAYYHALRLERAHELLTQTDLSVTEIAIACGYASSTHFARRYKRYFGRTPREGRVAGRRPPPVPR